jgi:hypothetical protein
MTPQYMRQGTSVRGTLGVQVTPIAVFDSNQGGHSALVYASHKYEMHCPDFPGRTSVA